MRSLTRRFVATAASIAAAAVAITTASSAFAVPPTHTPTDTTASAGAQSWLPSTPTYWPQVVGHQSTKPETIASGLSLHSETYQTVGGAQSAKVMNIDLDNKNLRFGAVEAGDKLIDPSDETISSMADRTGAIAGVNADFFAINSTGNPSGMLIQNGVLEASPVASWPYDLEVLKTGKVQMATETFSGTVTDTTSGTTQSLAAVNRIDQTGLTQVTPFLGAATLGASTILTGTVANGILTVTGIKTSQTALPQIPAGQGAFIARRGTAASTWLQTVHVGDTLSTDEHLAPYDLDQVETGLSGGAHLVQNGKMAVPEQGTGENNVAYPILGIGTDKSGTHAIMAVFDGRASEDTAVGLTRPQFAQWMMAHGVYNAVEFDSGGSAEMVGKMPGQAKVSVLNTPSDGSERPVADGLFLYSTESAPAAATTAVVNDGKPVAVLPGSSEQLTAYATDAVGNPASSPVRVSVSPSKLASVSGTPTTDGTATALTLTAGSRSGTGILTVSAGKAVSRVKLTVTDKVQTLSLTPADPNLDNGATQQFSVSGSTAGKTALTLTPSDVTWSVSPADLGTVSAGGLFTAAGSGNGLATVTATIGSTKTTTTVAVGSAATVVDPMTDTQNWGLNLTNGSTATLSPSTTELAQSGDSGSMDVHYSIPKASGVSQVVFEPKSGHTVTIDKSADGQAPTGIGVWVKGIGGTPAAPLANGALTFAESWAEVNGQTWTFYPTAVTYNGWQLITAQIPAGTQVPLRLSFLDFLVINPSQNLTGDLYVSDLEALYSPRPPTTIPYTAIPKNPSWLQFKGSPAQFTPGGNTIATWDDSHLVASDPNSTGSVVTDAIGKSLDALPSNAKADTIQVNGDLTDDGTDADLQYGFDKLQNFGIPFHDAVGNHEIGQGAEPQNEYWTKLFGNTHYSYTDGSAQVIETDSANGGLLASDPYQVPDEEQYSWMVQQLTSSTAKDIVLLTHMPAYDPHPIANSQFADRYEAQMYELIAQKFQQSHPDQHVILLFGHARGVAEQILEPDGSQNAHGVPNFTVADAGSPPYATVDQGGFYNYALFHFLPDGTIQFAIQPVLDSIAVTAPQASLKPHATEQLTATGTTPTGDDATALKVPIAKPASYVWSSSNPGVASIDPTTGQVIAHATGTAKISVVSGGVTGSTVLTVTR